MYFQDFHSLSHPLDQTPTRPSSPSSTAYASNYASQPVLHSTDNNNDLSSQPYDYSTRLSPVNLEADSIRQRRKRKVTRKVIHLDAKYKNDALDYSSSKPYLECVATARVPSMEDTEQVIKEFH